MLEKQEKTDNVHHSLSMLFDKKHSLISGEFQDSVVKSSREPPSDFMRIADAPHIEL